MKLNYIRGSRGCEQNYGRRGSGIGVQFHSTRYIKNFVKHVLCLNQLVMKAKALTTWVRGKTAYNVELAVSFINTARTHNSLMIIAPLGPAKGSEFALPPGRWRFVHQRFR